MERDKMMDGNNVQIIMKSWLDFGMMIDGVYIKRVTSCEFSTSVDEVPQITITFIPSSINAEYK